MEVESYNSVTGFVVGWVTLELSSEPKDVDGAWKEDFAAELDALPADAFPVLTRNMGRLENNAFMTRYDSGRSRPMDRSFAFALNVLMQGLRVVRP